MRADAEQARAGKVLNPFQKRSVTVHLEACLLDAIDEYAEEATHKSYRRIERREAVRRLVLFALRRFHRRKAAKAKALVSSSASPMLGPVSAGS
jgi:hypothetical protein